LEKHHEDRETEFDGFKFDGVLYQENKFFLTKKFVHIFLTKFKGATCTVYTNKYST